MYKNNLQKNGPLIIGPSFKKNSVTAQTYKHLLMVIAQDS